MTEHITFSGNFATWHLRKTCKSSRGSIGAFFSFFRANRHLQPNRSVLPMQPAHFIPPNIQEILKRKSSRDPSSRFETKLHHLLSFASQDPENEMRVGLGWLNDEEFKMNKTTLAAVMGIKLNTLNVNLRDVGFKQLQRDKGGWTKWRKENFTRTKCMAPVETYSSSLHGSTTNAFLGRTPTPFSLGHMTQQQTERFFMDCQELWQELMQVSPTSPIDSEIVIRQSAARFKADGQEDGNARDVIQAIIMPGGHQPKLGFADFCRLLAMFGPPETLMLKIQSLLQVANNSGKWLSFDPNNRDPSQSASFDPNMPNCLVIRQISHPIERVCNDPLLTSDDRYVVDDMGRYDSWDDYFQRKPFTPTLAYF